MTPRLEPRIADRPRWMRNVDIAREAEPVC